METENKTYREWFQQFDEPYKNKAIANTPTQLIDELVYADEISLAAALENAFNWIESPEGYKYWDKFYSTLLD